MLQNVRTKVGKLTSVRWYPEFPEKWKGGRIEKWKDYWLGVGRDYKEATREVITNSQAKPIKTICFLGTAGFLGYCMKTNPDVRDYQSNFTQNGLDLLLISDTIRNSRTENLHNYVSRAENANLIRRSNYGLFSVIWIDDYSEDLGLFAAQCEYLKPSLTDIRSRMVDIGFLGRWWISSKKMEECDVNAEEWDHNDKAVQPNEQLKKVW